MKEFINLSEFRLLKSEIKKVVKVANQINKCRTCIVTGFNTDGVVDENGFVIVICEVYKVNEEYINDFELWKDKAERVSDIWLCVYIEDRRRSMVSLQYNMRVHKSFVNETLDRNNIERW